MLSAVHSLEEEQEFDDGCADGSQYWEAVILQVVGDVLDLYQPQHRQDPSTRGRETAGPPIHQHVMVQTQV